MKKLLMVLAICAFAKAGKNRHQPKSVTTFEAYEWSRQAAHPIKTACTSQLDNERYMLDEKIRCSLPKEVFVTFNNVPRAAHEEYYPNAAWLKRCVGMCDGPGPGSTCKPIQSRSRQLPIRIINTKTWKEACALVTVEEHVSCQCCYGDPGYESCQEERKGKVFNSTEPGYPVESVAKSHQVIQRLNI